MTLIWNVVPYLEIAWPIFGTCAFHIWENRIPRLSARLALTNKISKFPLRHRKLVTKQAAKPVWGVENRKKTYWEFTTFDRGKYREGNVFFTTLYLLYSHYWLDNLLKFLAEFAVEESHVNRTPFSRKDHAVLADFCNEIWLLASFHRSLIPVDRNRCVCQEKNIQETNELIIWILDIWMGRGGCKHDVSSIFARSTESVSEAAGS